MSTSKKLDEIMELAMLLQNSYQGVTIDEMMDKLERPNRRAIERLMEVIKEKFGDKLEFIAHSNDRKKHWRLKKGSINSFVNFSNLELVRLEKLSNSIKNEAERKGILDIIEKIKILNPTKYYKNDIDFLLETQGLAVRQYTKEKMNSEIMDKIAYALQSQQKIKIIYKDSFGNYCEPILEPYGLKIADNHYLIAGVNIKNRVNFIDSEQYFVQFKIYKISRIENINILEDEYFEKDEGFDIQEYCNRSFGIYTSKVEEIILKFIPESAEYASNYCFHPTQKGNYNEDGSYTLKFNASGNFEIVTELLKWREGVNIIAPDSLKEEYEDTVKRMYNNIISNK